jgi:hypothetical protein
MGPRFMQEFAMFWVLGSGNISSSQNYGKTASSSEIVSCSFFLFNQNPGMIFCRI